MSNESKQSSPAVNFKETMRHLIFKIRMWVCKVNPYHRIKGCKNEIRLLIEERERLINQLEKLHPVGQNKPQNK